MVVRSFVRSPGMLVVLVVALATVACGGASARARERARAFERDGRLADAVAAARQAVADAPGDRDARVLLARLEARAGRPGAALRQYQAAVELAADEARAPLGKLYAARGLARARLHQRERWRDFDRALDLASQPIEVLEARAAARVDAGLVRWARGDLAGARALWASAPPVGAAFAQVIDDPERVPLPLLAAAAQRAYTVVGATAAWPLLDAYARRGGDDRAALAAVQAARRARDPGEPPPAWRSPAGESGAAALDAALNWRGRGTLAPEVVAGVVALAARAWLYGERDAPVDAALAALVERELAGRSLDELPRWSRPAIARLQGDARAARAAHAAGPGNDVPPEAEALVALEWPDALAAPAGAAAADTRTRWLARATLARRAGDGQAAARAYAALAGDDAAWLALGARGDAAALLWTNAAAPAEGPTRRAAEAALARWKQHLHGLAAGGDDAALARAALATDLDAAAYARTTAAPALPLAATAPLVPAGCRELDLAPEAYAAATRAYAADPVAGAAAIDDWIDVDVLPTCRGLAAATFYLDAQDPARARALADRLIAIEPGDADALVIAVRAAAAQKDGQAARLYLEQAEDWSRARGNPSAAAVDVFVAEGQPIDAIAAGRQALALAEGATRYAAYEALCLASAAAGRHRDVDAALTAYLTELPERLRDDARARLVARLGAAGVPVAAAWRPLRPGERARALTDGGARLEAYAQLAPDDAEVILARARAAGDPAAAAAVLDGGLVRLPWAIDLLAARAALEPAGSPARTAGRARLLLLCLLAPAPDRRATARAAFDAL